MTERQTPFEPRPEPAETYEVRLPLTDKQGYAVAEWFSRYYTQGHVGVRDLMQRIGVLKHD